MCNSKLESSAAWVVVFFPVFVHDAWTVYCYCFIFEQKSVLNNAKY